MSKEKSTERDAHLLREAHMVQLLIEMCLQIYMHPSQVVDKLFHRAGIQPCVTEIIWKRLEKENPEFFKIYYTRVTLKKQITRFNEILQQKAAEIHSNYQQHIPLENMQHMTNVMPNFYANGEESWQQVSMHDAVGMQGGHTMSLAEGSNVGTINGFNGVYSPVMFGAADNGIGETSIPPYVGEISNASTIEELFTVWQSAQMTRGFSSTTDCNDTDIFANISLSPLAESDENIDESNVAADINGQDQGSNDLFGLEFFK